MTEKSLISNPSQDAMSAHWNMKRLHSFSIHPSGQIEWLLLADVDGYLAEEEESLGEDVDDLTYFDMMKKYQRYISIFFRI